MLTPSFLSLSSAPWRNSIETSSFSSSHCMTNGSNHLKIKAILKSKVGRFHKDPKRRNVILPRSLAPCVFISVLIAKDSNNPGNIFVTKMLQLSKGFSGFSFTILSLVFPDDVKLAGAHSLQWSMAGICLLSILALW